MLIAASYLVDRARHGRARADDVMTVRLRLAAAPGPSGANDDEVALARELGRLREELAAAFGAVESCHGCGRGHPLPHGRWDGGHCCGTRTELVFTDDEVAALRLAGTLPEHLVPPPGAERSSDAAPHGCAFRGPEGCSLAPVNRPSLCVRFVCRELEQELRERGDLGSIRAIANELAATFERFRRLRAARVPTPEPWA